MFCPWCDGGMTLGRTLLGALLFLFVFAAILALLGLAVWLIIRASRGAAGGNYPPGANRPLEILKERYARGEITREEYEELRRDLET
jgi:putative membrane protein